MRVLGISAYYHDAAAALVVDGRVTAAAQEERFTRVKHDKNFPVNAMRFCLEKASCRPEEIDAVVFYDKPALKFDRLVQTHFAFAPKGLGTFLEAQTSWLGDKLFQRRALRRLLSEDFSSDIDWGKKALSVRINGLDTHYMYRDVVDVLEQASDRVDLIMIPKVGTAADVYAVDMLATQIETAKGRRKRVGFEMIIETALGMQNVEII